MKSSTYSPAKVWSRVTKFVYYYDEEYAAHLSNTIKGIRRRVDLRGRHILCLGSGTGSVPLSYFEAGARSVTCLDISTRFLDVIRHKLEQRPEIGDRMKLIRGDMAKLQLHQRFDRIFINGNSFVSLLSQEEQLSCLRGLREHLTAKGIAYINLIPYSNRLNGSFKLKRSFVDKEGLKVQESAYTTVNYDQHVLTVHIKWKSRRGTFHEDVPIRILPLSEMQLLLMVSKLKLVALYGDGWSHKPGKASYEYILAVQRE